MTEKQILGFNPAPRLEHIAANIPSACRIANIALIDAMILPYDANLGRMEFSERTPPTQNALSLCVSFLSLFRNALFSLVCFSNGAFSRQLFLLRHLSPRNIFSTL
jgi:hypothetical protein